MSSPDAVAGLALSPNAVLPQGVRLSVQAASGPWAHAPLTLDWALTPNGDAL